MKLYFCDADEKYRDPAFSAARFITAPDPATALAIWRRETDKQEYWSVVPPGCCWEVPSVAIRPTAHAWGAAYKGPK